MTTASPAAAPAQTQSFLRRIGSRSAYVLTEFPIAIARFVVLLPMFLLGIGTFVTVLGVPILAGTMGLSRIFADVDRGRLSRLQGWPAQRPHYRTNADKSGLSRLLAMLGQAQRWADWGHGVLAFVPAVVAFVLTFTWWAAGVGGTLSFAWYWAIPDSDNDQGLAELIGFGTGKTANALLSTLIGLFFLATLPAIVRMCSGMLSGLARFMLTSDRVAVLHEQVSDLASSRDAAVSAEASALRRLERDIHDGPQQRLVRLAMDLSTAQRRLQKDPDAAQPLIAEAIAQTRETLDELRALSRGIAPPILADRGLAAALAAVAARSTVTVDLEVAMPDGNRLPSAVENAAYFVVAEALTNVAKHSQATHCRVDVSRTTESVRVIITDDGVGGAHPAKGHGLSGLVDRVRAIGGKLDVESPIGGPTILAAEIPCPM
jgi:signal transduction histidine kinase